MYKKSFFAVLALLIAVLMIVPMIPVSAWDYTDEESANDEMYEKFGPRADRLLIKLYEDAEAEWDSLDRGELDVTDWPLTKPYYDKFTTPDEDNYTETMYYGAGFGLRLLDINNNPDPFMGNPPDPAYPNPVYPNPTSQINMRKAIWYCHDKATWLKTIIGVGFYADLYTCVPPCFGAFHKPMANPYPYNPAAAIAELETDEDGDTMPDFPWEDANDDTIRDEGEVFWDINGNGENDGGDEELCIIFVVRSDDVHRLSVANKLIAELRAIGICVDARYGPVALAYTLWFYGKAAHLYTAGWGLTVDPDHIILWNYFFYWHPGFCYNTGAVHDPILDDTSWAVMTANTEADALTNCLAFQDRFDDVAAAVPWWSYSGTMAMYRTYTGGTGGAAAGDDEDQYRGKYWDGVVNVPGGGLDGFWSFLNMHPRGNETGVNMTIRYGFKTAELKSFNPVYAEWVWEWAVLGEIYDSLLARNPYTLEPGPWMASNYDVENYMHPVFGTCTKVTFTLAPDVYFADGTPLTVADIYFTFVQLDDILLGRGLPPPWWYDSVAMILSFSILDAYSFEVLFDTKSIYYLMRPGGTVILPQHLWKPLAETGPVDSMTAEPNMIGPGPWRFKEYKAYSHILMVANKPGSTVQTSHEGSTTVMSPMGYFRLNPLSVELEPDDFDFKFDFKGEVGYTVNVTAYNRALWLSPWVTLCNTTPVDLNNPVCSQWHVQVCHTTSGRLKVCDDVHLKHWDDDGDGKLSSNDILIVEKKPLPGKEYWGYVHCGGVRWNPVKSAWCMCFCDNRLVLNKYVYIDGGLTLEIHAEATYRPGDPIEFEVNVTATGYHTVKECVHVKSPPWLYCRWINRTIGIWITIKEDIAGSTYYDDIGLSGYPHKKALPTPDIKVDIKDVAKAAKAFGSYPGHIRWDTLADIYQDYKIDIKDIAGIAKQYGWIG